MAAGVFIGRSARNRSGRKRAWAALRARGYVTGERSCVGKSSLESDWADAGTKVILRHCPICVQDSIVGHGRRRKQAHDEHHDWIRIRRGLCNRCGKTFTFLPPFSPPYGHYSFIARSQALQLYFLEGRCWEDAAPTVIDPDRVADPFTLRRWFRHLDSSRPPFSALCRTMLAIGAWLGRTEPLVYNSLPLRRHTVYPFLGPLLASANLKKPAPPTILAWEDGWLPPTLDSGGENVPHGRESGALRICSTATAAAAVAT